ncbi:MAG: biotin/lipoyl-binding protein, partial [Pseudomonadota bacterium]
MENRDVVRPVWSASFPIFIGFFALLILVAGLGAWSVFTQLAGAVVSSGVIEVQSNRQVVQHPEGGVVGEILVRDGDAVEAGQLLLRFDDTFVTSELAIVEGQLYEIWARKARLAAERDGTNSLTIDGELAEIVEDNPLAQSL